MVLKWNIHTSPRFPDICSQRIQHVMGFRVWPGPAQLVQCPEITLLRCAAIQTKHERQRSTGEPLTPWWSWHGRKTGDDGEHGYMVRRWTLNNLVIHAFLKRPYGVRRSEYRRGTKLTVTTLRADTRHPRLNSIFVCCRSHFVGHNLWHSSPDESQAGNDDWKETQYPCTGPGR